MGIFTVITPLISPPGYASKIITVVISFNWFKIITVVVQPHDQGHPNLCTPC